MLFHQAQQVFTELAMSGVQHRSIMRFRQRNAQKAMAQQYNCNYIIIFQHQYNYDNLIFQSWLCLGFSRGLGWESSLNLVHQP